MAWEMGWLEKRDRATAYCSARGPCGACTPSPCVLPLLLLLLAALLLQQLLLLLLPWLLLPTPLPLLLPTLLPSPLPPPVLPLPTLLLLPLLLPLLLLSPPPLLARAAAEPDRGRSSLLGLPSSNDPSTPEVRVALPPCPEPQMEQQGRHSGQLHAVWLEGRGPGTGCRR